jgi:hypothetical protein
MTYLSYIAHNTDMMIGLETLIKDVVVVLLLPDFLSY